MNDRLAIACALALVACRPDAAPRSDVYDRAGDAGYEWVPMEGSRAALAGTDASERPSIARVAGYPGGRGDLDGVGNEARIGLVSGMARVKDTLLFADEGNGSIRRFDPATGKLDTLARLPRPPDGAPALPAYVAYDGKKTLYVSDRSAQVIYAMNTDTHAVTPFAGQLGVRDHVDGDVQKARFDAPTGLAFDGAHALYVGDVGNHHIRKIDLDSRTVSTLEASFLQVWGLCVDGDALYASDVLAEALFRVDPGSGKARLVVGSNRFGYAGSIDGPAPKARLHGPRGLSCTHDGVFVAERWNGLVRRWDVPSSTLGTVAGTATMLGWRDGGARNALFADTQAVLAWDDDTLYVGDEGALRKLSRGNVSTVAGSPKRAINLQLLEEDAMSEPTGVAIADGAAFVSSCGTNTIQRVDLATGVTRTFAGDPIIRGFIDDYGTNARFDCAASIASDGHAHLFVGDRNNHAIRDVAVPGARVLAVAGTPSKCGNDDGTLREATFCDPAALVYDDGVIFVADAGTSTIRRIDLAAGKVSTLAGAAFERGNADGVGPSARFAYPTALAFHAGKLYVADRENDAVRVVDVSSGGVSTLPVHVERPLALAFRGEDLLVADRRALRRIALATHSARDLLPVTGGLRLGSNEPSLHRPSSIVDVSEGDALVVDAAENALVRVAY